MDRLPEDRGVGVGGKKHSVLSLGLQDKNRAETQAPEPLHPYKCQLFWITALFRQVMS